MEETVRRDPDYSEAWAVLSTIYAQEYRFPFNPRLDEYDPYDRALAAAKRAVEIDPKNATAQLMLANAYFDQHRLDAFKKAGDLAVSLSPNNPDILAHYAQRLAYMGEWDRGLTLMSKAVALNPFHPGWYSFPVAFFHYDRGDYVRALTVTRKIDMPHFPAYRMLLAACLGQLGLQQEAQAEAQALQGLDPEYLAQLWQVLGAWNFPRSLVQHVAEGLRKAGLDVPLKPPES